MNMLPIVEHFYTIQGEGRNTGRAAYFVRIGGCDVGCVWCDVKESWDASKHPELSIDEIKNLVLASGTKNVVITGGEPMMFDLTELTAELKNAGLNLWLETSGAYPISGNWDWICVSPKKFKAPLDEALAKADELKVIVFNHSDFEWAEKHLANTNSYCIGYLQPEYSRLEKIIPEIVEYVKQHQQWIISLQTHKVINVP
ncbi:MAG: 7-carboxy-7-deazaguanine synthase QueE [Bacteroidia bacterium]